MFDNFNPRPREEGDGGILGIIDGLLDFNPRPREEGDNVYAKNRRRYKDFNPRPREEGDLLRLTARLFMTVFQSTPS